MFSERILRVQRLKTGPGLGSMLLDSERNRLKMICRSSSRRPEIAGRVWCLVKKKADGIALRCENWLVAVGRVCRLVSLVLYVCWVEIFCQKVEVYSGRKTARREYRNNIVSIF